MFSNLKSRLKIFFLPARMDAIGFGRHLRPHVEAVFGGCIVQVYIIYTHKGPSINHAGRFLGIFYLFFPSWTLLQNKVYVVI